MHLSYLIPTSRRSSPSVVPGRRLHIFERTQLAGACLVGNLSSMRGRPRTHDWGRGNSEFRTLDAVRKHAATFSRKTRPRITTRARVPATIRTCLAVAARRRRRTRSTAVKENHTTGAGGCVGENGVDRCAGWRSAEKA